MTDEAPQFAQALRNRLTPAAMFGRSGLTVSSCVLISAWIAILAFLIHEVSSLDIWWQVTIGTDIIEHLRVPTIDFFSALGMGRPYHDSHWFFQAIMASAHRVMGMIGVEIVMILVLAATFAVCYRSCRRWASVFSSSVLMFLAAMASVERFLPRPEMVTFLGIAVFYNLLQRRSHSSIRETVALVAMQVVWANSHGLFVIGPFMVGCYLLVELVDRLRGGGSNLAPLVRAFGAVLLATLITPFGLNGWRYAALLFTEVGSGGPALMGTLGELSTTFGDAARSGPAFWFFLVLLVLGGIAVVVQIASRKLSPRLLIVLGLGAAALTGRRNIVLFSIAAAPFIAESLAATAIGRLHLPKVARIAAAALFLGWAIYPLSGAYYIRMEIPARWGFGVTPSFFPHELPGFLDEIEFEGQVLNSNTFGGFYGYHGFPDRIPLTDGRWEIYDKIEIVRVLEGSRHASAWRDLVDEYGISGILLAHTSPEATILLPSLRAARDWRLVYLDRAASFWLPDDGSLFPPEIKLDHGSLPDTPRFDDTLIMNSFLAGIGAHELRAENLRRALEFGHRKRLILEQLGPLQIEIGHFDEAEATYQNLATENPRSAAPLNELAFLAYRRGDLQRARDLIRSAIDLEPENLEFRENLQRVEQAIQQHSGKKGDGG